MTQETINIDRLINEYIDQKIKELIAKQTDELKEDVKQKCIQIMLDAVRDSCVIAAPL